MSECMVPSWNLSHQRQQQEVAREVAREEGNRSSSHVHNQPHPGYVVPLSNYEVAELTWENGQLAMHSLAGILPAPAVAPAEKGPTFGRAGDTLESLVHQATCYKQNEKIPKQLQETTELQAHTNTINAAVAAAASGGKRPENTVGNVQLISPGSVKKRLRLSESDQCGRYNLTSSRIRSLHEDQVGGGATERSTCASASATFCREKDATIMTWASFESPGSQKTKTTDEDSACHDGSGNRDEELETKEETVRSHSEIRNRAAFIHNQSERRRRDRINQKMKALQKLVPNASKTDKASMLDEVIEYLKKLQAQVHMMSTRNMPQMMMNPLAMQQQMQMSLLARMGMGVGQLGLGMGMGMLDVNALARSTSHHPLQPGFIPAAPMASVTPTFLPPHFVLPTPPVPTCSPSPPKSPAVATTDTTSAPFADPYSAFFAQQSMNMDFYSKMAALYGQAANQATQPTSNSSRAKFTPRE